MCSAEYVSVGSNQKLFYHQSIRAGNFINMTTAFVSIEQILTGYFQVVLCPRKKYFSGSYAEIILVTICHHKISSLHKWRRCEFLEIIFFSSIACYFCLKRIDWNSGAIDNSYKICSKFFCANAIQRFSIAIVE